MLLEPTVNALVDPGFEAKARVFEQHGEVRNPNGVYVDGTFGRGGHSRLLLSRLGPGAKLVVFDKDPVAIQAALELQSRDPRVQVIHGGFASMFEEMQAKGLTQVDGIMLDLGVSSPQIDDPERGFSFMREGPLDMRMDTSRGMTAAQWLAEADVDEIREVIAKYGEERFAFQIAKAIVGRRESRPLRTTLDLAELVASVVRTREKGQHPATRSFQALRIHINQELEELARALAAALRLLAPGGRLAVISFHSLEDRMVKQCIAAARRRSEAQSRLPIFEKDMPRPILEPLGKVLPTDEEAKENPRARSSVLRVAQRTDEPLPADAESFVNAIRLVPQKSSRAARRKK